MKRLIIIILTLFVPLSGIGQTRIILNNDAFIVLDNGANLVVDNNNPNALSTSGTGGNIVSEGEQNLIKWNIGTNTGLFIVPFTTMPVAQGGNSTKIPVEINVTTSGAGAGALLFATYETADDNTPWATGITNMNSGLSDLSLSVIDRFWILQPLGFTTNPTATIAFTYDDAANETGGANTINETELQAQRWNSNINDWEGILLGVVNTVTNRVSGIPVTPTDFHSQWILVGRLSPLPVELVSFEGKCTNGKIQLLWLTSSEINNDYFIIETSTDTKNFKEAGKVRGQGNSNQSNIYTHTLNTESTEVAYYRLKQVDYDGMVTYSKVISVEDCENQKHYQDEILAYPNPFNDKIHLQWGNYSDGETVSLEIYNVMGTLLKRIPPIQEKEATISLNELPTGTYYLHLTTPKKYHIVKLVKL